MSTVEEVRALHTCVVAEEAEHHNGGHDYVRPPLSIQGIPVYSSTNFSKREPVKFQLFVETLQDGAPCLVRLTLTAEDAAELRSLLGGF